MNLIDESAQIARAMSDIFRVHVVNQGGDPVVVDHSAGPEPGQTLLTWMTWLRTETSTDHKFDSMVKDADQMDEYSETHVALDAYADEATQPDLRTEQSVWVTGSDSGQVRALRQLFSERLRIEEIIWSLARQTGKYGNQFERVIFEKGSGKGVLGIAPAPVTDIRPDLDQLGRLKGYKITEGEGKATGRDQGMVAPWEYIHFKIMGQNRMERMGDSMLLGASSVWKRLKLVEEAIAIYRLSRAPDRLIYSIDVGPDVDPIRALEIAREYQRKIKKRVFVDPTDGTFKAGTSPASMETDIFWPVRQGSNTRVERLPGGADITSLADLEMLQNKLFRALRLPRDYLGGEGLGSSLDLSRALARQDIRVARFVRRLRRALLVGFTDLAQVHLALSGISHDPKTFQVNMSPILAEDEERQARIAQEKLRTADEFMRIMGELGVKKEALVPFVLNRILDLEEKDIKLLGVEVKESFPSPSQASQIVSSRGPAAELAARQYIDQLVEEMRGDGDGEGLGDDPPDKGKVSIEVSSIN